MNSHLFPTSTPILGTIIAILITIAPCLCVDDAQFLNCSTLITCGSLSGIGYPFWGQSRSDYCGYRGFELNCTNDTPEITIENFRYKVLNMNAASREITLVRDDYSSSYCPATYANTTLDFSIFDYSSTTNITFIYDCPTGSTVVTTGPNTFTCPAGGATMSGYYFSVPTSSNFGCGGSVLIPVLTTAATSLQTTQTEANLLQAVEGGFGLVWSANDTLCHECANSGGLCGRNTTTEGFVCYCADIPYPTTCGNSPPSDTNTSGEKKSSSIVPIAVGVSAASAAILVLCLIFIYMRKRKQQAIKEQSLASESKSKGLPTPNPSSYFSQSIPSYPSSNIRTDLEKGSTYFGVQVFTDTELEEATNNFDATKILGDGGFGTVYYGTLRDGRIVAVKRLFENNFKRVEQFMNEVEILTRLRHKNLVTLFGCTSRRSRELLLVYEYIPNGTVADHVHGKHSNSGLLTWPVRLSIAIETADALAYLHRSDVIHRDVKTNNILLDNEFRVKVADFGLSRLFPTDVTHISTAPQGTPGYVDPEYYQCYQLTEKSDVYSYGVVLMELVSSKLAVDTSRHRHDINLANMAVNKIQNQTLDELVDSSIGFHTDEAVKRKVTMVCQLAFRCLQPERDMRPTMEEVLEALREIEKKDFSAENQEVVDIGEDYVGLLKNELPPVLPDEKWVSNTTTPNSSSG